MIQLEKEVLEIINEIVEGCYIGKLEVIETPYYRNYSCKPEDRCNKGVVVNLTYDLHFFLNADFEPMIMSYMYRTRKYDWKKWGKLEEDPGWEPKSDYIKQAQNAFKKFVSEEFKARMLQQVDYYKINLQLPSIDCNE